MPLCSAIGLVGAGVILALGRPIPLASRRPDDAEGDRLDPRLLEILACPEDKGPLLYFADEDCLYNPRLRKRYGISDL